MIYAIKVIAYEIIITNIELLIIFFVIFDSKIPYIKAPITSIIIKLNSKYFNSEYTKDITNIDTLSTIILLPLLLTIFKNNKHTQLFMEIV